jgi:hypothetical protein
VKIFHPFKLNLAQENTNTMKKNPNWAKGSILKKLYLHVIRKLPIQYGCQTTIKSDHPKDVTSSHQKWVITFSSWDIILSFGWVAWIVFLCPHLPGQPHGLPHPHIQGWQCGSKVVMFRY